MEYDNMFENIYLDELKNDVEFLDELHHCIESERIFLPFLLTNYEQFFNMGGPDENGHRRGISEDDVKTLCKASGICTPYLMTCGYNSIGLHKPFVNDEVPDRLHYEYHTKDHGKRYFIGIGHYKTLHEGEMHMCVLIDMSDLSIASVSFSDTCDPQITSDAVAHVYHVTFPEEILVHSSRNSVFQKPAYKKICNQYGIIMSMTQPGSRGGVAPVSRFFSTLKRRLGDYAFTDYQDAVDWLSTYIVKYNVEHYEDE